MLSKALAITTESKLCDLEVQIAMIECHATRTIVSDIVFGDSPLKKVRLMPFDYNWVFKDECRSVLDATIELSAIMFALRNIQNIAPHDQSITRVLGTVDQVYKDFKEAVRELCCSRPPYRTGTHLDIKDIMACAELIRAENRIL